MIKKRRSSKDQDDSLVSGFGKPVEEIAREMVWAAEGHVWDTLELNVSLVDDGVFDFEFYIISKQDKISVETSDGMSLTAVSWFDSLKSSGEEIWSSFSLIVKKDLTFDIQLKYD